MNQRWKVELHSHTRYSRDSLVRPETFIDACSHRGIDRVVVTDHNTAQAGLHMARLAPDLVIPGEEIMTPQGEILAYFVRETIPPMLSPAETIRRLRDQGAFISVSHPFDRLRKGAWQIDDLLHIIDQVDAIEVFNARCLFPDDNVKAQEFARAQSFRGCREFHRCATRRGLRDAPQPVLGARHEHVRQTIAEDGLVENAGGLKGRPTRRRRRRSGARNPGGQ
jgi:hypothetical protein